MKTLTENKETIYSAYARCEKTNSFKSWDCTGNFKEIWNSIKEFATKNKKMASEWKLFFIKDMGWGDGSRSESRDSLKFSSIM